MKRHAILIVFLVLLLFIPPLTGKSKTKSTTPVKGKLESGTFSALKFRNIGPALMSGRISDIAIHPKKQGTWYIAVGSGGVWKTVNAGVTLEPIFDDQPSYSIGCVTLDPNNPETVWVGTGENVSGRHVGYGDGIYRSLNGGKTWENMGLKQSEHISKIFVDPRDSNIIYVAAEGPLWTPGGERGIYKSTDGGKTWKISLEISKNTGCSDIVAEPGNTDILYASAYQRRRSVAAFIGGGPESGIYKSTDAGKNWRKLSVGLPKGDIGRIGLAVSPIKPEVVYATIEANKENKGFYRSENRGESWEKRDSYTSGGTGPHYYQEIYADPHRFDCVYQMDVRIHVTTDGGQTFRRLGEKKKHSDNHSMAFDPSNPDYLLVGSDGGLYETFDWGKTWRFLPHLPVTQFYKLALDNIKPFYNIHGGTQDNGSQLGPSRTIYKHGITNRDWQSTLGADGYGCAIDPEDPNTIYAEWQIGSLRRVDKKSGQTVDIQPQPEPGEDPPRWNWDSPILISPHSHTRLYFGSQRLYRSDNRGDSWKAISPDLTRGVFRLTQPIMGKQWSVNSLWDHNAMSYYGSLTCISESPLKEGLIYIGTDDGLIQVTEDNGNNWRKIAKIPGVPQYTFVNQLQADKHNADTVFAVFDNHKRGDFKPYIYKSTDRGRTWVSISGDLPDRHIVWAVAQDHKKPRLLFAGTEFGIFFTLDGGKRWIKFKSGVPTIAFRDIKIQERENDLVGASFGRGFFVLDDYSPLRSVDETLLQKEAHLFPVKKALQYVERRSIVASDHGHAIFIAPNPPYGAIFTYYLKDSLKTRKKQRLEKEKELNKAGKPIPFPGWKELNVEEKEEEPVIILTVKDSGGNVVNRVTGSVSGGIHRVAWNLRNPGIDPVSLEEKKSEWWDRATHGPMVVPGKYTVTLAKRVEGKLTPLGDPGTFEVESLGFHALAAKDRKELLAFQEKAGRLMRAMLGVRDAARESGKRLQVIKKALRQTPAAPAALADEARDIEKRLHHLYIQLVGDPARRKLDEPRPPSLLRRVDRQLNTTAPITETGKRSYKIVARQFTQLLEQMRQIIDVEIPKLEEKMEAAGAPYTPGRKLPRFQYDS